MPQEQKKGDVDVPVVPVVTYEEVFTPFPLEREEFDFTSSVSPEAADAVWALHLAANPELRLNN